MNRQTAAKVAKIGAILSKANENAKTANRYWEENVRLAKITGTPNAVDLLDNLVAELPFDRGLLYEPYCQLVQLVDYVEAHEIIKATAIRSTILAPVDRPLLGKSAADVFSLSIEAVITLVRAGKAAKAPDYADMMDAIKQIEVDR